MVIMEKEGTGVTAVLAVLGGAVVLSNSCVAPFLCKKNTAGLLSSSPEYTSDFRRIV